MRPLLFEIGDLRFHSYSFFLALGFLVATLLASREGQRLKNPVFVPPQGAVWALLGALVGSKVYYILQYMEPRDLWRAVFIWEGGLVFYGGVIGGAVASIAYLYFTKALDWRVADVCAAFLPLGQAFGRTGCFLNGCCWGSECHLPWAVHFPRGSDAYYFQRQDGLIAVGADSTLHIHPTQLYSIIGLLLIFFLLRSRLHHSAFTGAVAFQYFIFYGALRFTVEMFRGDSARPLLGMTASQMVAIGLFVFGLSAYLVGIYMVSGRNGRPLESPVEDGGT